MAEWHYIIPPENEVEKSYPAPHRGRPGERGGSLPRKGKAGVKAGGKIKHELKLPASKWDGKSEKLTRFQDSRGQEFSTKERNITAIIRYGDIVFVGSKHGANRYARLYNVKGKRILPGLSNEPITGRVRAAKNLAQQLAKLTDWSALDELSKPQVDLLQDKVMAQLNAFQRGK